MTLRIHWNWLDRLIAFLISLPLFLLVLWVEWPSDEFFIAALIAGGIISLVASWTITPKIQRKWQMK